MSKTSWFPRPHHHLGPPQGRDLCGRDKCSQEEETIPPSPPTRGQSHCGLESLQTMKSILLDVSSVSPPSFWISFPLFSSSPFCLCFSQNPSASCWVTSPWEADTMADIILSTPSEPCFPRDSPGPVGMKPMLFTRPAGPYRDEAHWLPSPSQVFPS